MESTGFYERVRQALTELLPQLGPFQVRSGQLEMALAVAQALVNKEALLVQAGTGVGKTLAYLVPGLLWRLEYGGDPLLVATYTTNLQQQIVDKDYPLLREGLGWSFRLVQALGRGRYLCRQRFQRLYKRRYHYPHWRELLEGLQEVIESESYSLFDEGWDMAPPLRGVAWEFKERLPSGLSWNEEIWPEIASENLNCLKRSCPFFKRCYFYRERNLVLGADLCVTNQALLCATLRQGALGRLLPKISLCVVDEAHHLEEVAISQFSSAFDNYTSSEFLQSLARPAEEQPSTLHLEGEESSLQLFNPQPPSLPAPENQSISGPQHYPEGWFARVQEALDDLAEHYPRLQILELQTQLAQLYWDNLNTLRQRLQLYLQNLERYYRELSGPEPQAGYASVTLLQSDWLASQGEVGRELERAGSAVEEALLSFSGGLYALHNLWQRLAERVGLQEEDHALGILLQGGREQLDKFLDNFLTCHRVGKEPQVRGHWLETSRGQVRLRSAALEVDRYLLENLLQPLPTLVFTSATLKLGGDFQFFQKRLGLQLLPESRQRALSVASPFRYAEQVFLGVAQDLNRLTHGQPASQGHLQQLAQFIWAAAHIWQGRTLVLATSRHEMEGLYQRLAQPLAQAGITLLKQSPAARAQQIERLRQAPQRGEKIVLLGMDSFWEGVDVPGAALSCVILLRLPFSSPDSPLSKLRALHLGSQHFAQYALPMAILKFCQGFGRLLRSERDRGVVFLLDNRLSPHLGKNYARQFLNSLPGYTLDIAPAKELLRHAREWHFRSMRNA